MISESLKKRYEKQVRPQVDRASSELKKVLRDLGVDLTQERSLKDVVAQIREKNPTLKDFTLNLDVATYDLRKKLWWDANMMTAYVYDQAGKAYESEVKPKISTVRERAESEARKLMVQLRELTARASTDKESDESSAS